MKQGSVCRREEYFLILLISLSELVTAFLYSLRCTTRGFDVFCFGNMMMPLKRSIAFSSKRISGSLLNPFGRHATECELLSFAMLLKLFRPYLAGLTVNIFTYNLHILDCPIGKYKHCLKMKVNVNFNFYYLDNSMLPDVDALLRMYLQSMHGKHCSCGYDAASFGFVAEWMLDEDL